MSGDAIPKLFGEGAVVHTKIYDHTLRAPAAERWPITRAFDEGAAVDVISSSLAAGGKWITGRAAETESDTAVWLSAIDVPFAKFLAAWWIDGPARSRPYRSIPAQPLRARSMVSG